MNRPDAHRADAAPAQEPAEEFAESGATILVVDDTPQSLSVLSEFLAPFYRVRAVNSGERALTAACREPRPDLILLDIMMSEMDGFEVLRRLRTQEETRNIPVIFVTAVHDDEDEQRGFELGAADYIHKPIRGPIVLSRVRAQLDAHAARELLRSSNLRLVHQVAEGAHALEQAQLQLLQAEKMAAMGQLAAGVAHEINNPVGFVGSNLGSLESYLKDLLSIINAYEQAELEIGNAQAFAEARNLREQFDYEFIKRDAASLLAESRDGINRVRKIAQDLKDFSRIGNSEWQWVDLHQCIDSTLNIVWHELKYHCTVRKNYGTLPRVHCLPSQLNQVFMNLLVNAGQAIEGRGEIVISTESAGSAAVRVQIDDNGKGIEPDVLSRIFEPFFTTKPPGKGTGLGLSLAQGIVQRHHGRMEASSEPGKGTSFVLTLPIDPAILASDEDGG